MLDKDTNLMLESIKPISDELILTWPNIKRAEELDKLKGIVFNNRFGIISIFYEVHQAINYAKEQKKDTIVVGSFYLASETLETLKLREL